MHQLTEKGTLLQQDSTLALAFVTLRFTKSPSHFVIMTRKEWLSVARYVLLSRYIDEVEETTLTSNGLITYQFSAKGHELSQVILAANLKNTNDAATVYYRSRPFALACGLTPTEAIASSLARVAGRSNGRDIGVVHNLPKRDFVTILPSSGDVGAQYTPAVGWAQAIKYRNQVLGEESWHASIAVVLGGDASVATNGFWSALNIATVNDLPLLFFIEDNGYGISVPSSKQIPGGNIADNLAAFTNLRILECDGTIPDELDLMISKTVSYVRGNKPALVRVRVRRLCGHSGADNQSYKSAEIIEAEENSDPIPRLRDFLIRMKHANEESWQALEDEVRATVHEAVQAAVESAEPTANTVYQHVFFDGKVPLHGGLLSEGIQPAQGTDIPDLHGPRVNMIESIRRTLDHELEINSRSLIFGEDVGIKGGVHGATVDLQVKHGESRVFDTSLSEEGIIGRAVGMALAGLVPIPEIQFRKYLDPAMEQINDCGTLRWRTNGDFAAPVIVRIPIGFSKRTGDPWHSVSGEAIFTHTLGWKVALPSNAVDAAGLLRTALRGHDPVFFLEHRAIQDALPGRGPYPGNEYMIPFGKATIASTGKDITVVTWGEMVHRALGVVKDSRISAEVIDLRTLVPWDSDAVLSSVKKTGRCLVLHEDTLVAGFGAEIAACVQRECFMFLDAPVERLAVQGIPIPYNITLMTSVIPSAAQIHRALERLLRF